jgi:biopolymer transport protein ExbD
MKLPIYITLFLVSTISCAQQDDKPQEYIPKALGIEIIDVRIYEDGRIFINGNSTNHSALSSLIESMDISEKTLARFIFVMGEQTPLVYETTRQFQKQGTFNIHKIILPQAEFYTYLEQNIHLDIMKNGQVLLDGNQLFVEDLLVALKAPDITPDKTIIFTLPENFSKSTHNRSLEILDSLGLNRIEYADISEY